ncbi:hypothetical protein AMTR_s00034p00237620 [Amborella trichopoda]|uniref:Uncharacterized protein n=1 Tax=Amborella trichopoda TaxID=13333 RepID=W1PWU5_AMBTC|nr:hypothetical protein AMTR_s00034p00237620 [Amborella trichopoda]
MREDRLHGRGNPTVDAVPAKSGSTAMDLCAAYSTTAAAETTWTMRTTFPEYVVALATIVGSVLFTIFGGVGIFCLPLGLIFSFIRRPKAVITHSQYIKLASYLILHSYELRLFVIFLAIRKKARELKKAAAALHQEEKSGSKGRKWRKNVEAVEKELLLLEEDTKALEEVYNVFQIAFIVFAGLTFIYYALFGWRRRKPTEEGTEQSLLKNGFLNLGSPVPILLCPPLPSVLIVTSISLDVQCLMPVCDIS